MIKKLLLTLGVMAMTGLVVHQMRAASKEGLLREQFVAFKRQYNKTYDSLHELEYRFEVFKQSLRKIDEINSDPSKTFTAAVNKFTDLTFAEFKSKYLTYRSHSGRKSVAHEMPQEFLDEHSYTDFSKKDWREEKGAVGPIKDQGECGSCWTFSSVASLETEIWKKTKKSVSLSEQELVDCAWREYGNLGCNGGEIMNAYKYILDNQIATEENYPYKGIDMKCNITNKKKPNRQGVNSYYIVPEGNIRLSALVSNHVVSVAYEVTDDFQYYSSGVYTNNDPDCGNNLNHAMAVVGYNYDVQTPYYIVRNSWGTNVGINGYYRIAIGKETSTGTCGIASGGQNIIPVSR